LGKEKIVKKFVGCQTNKQKEACLLQNVHNLFQCCCQEIGNKERSGVEGVIIIIIINGEISPSVILKGLQSPEVRTLKKK
jgi:hypothetical protein